MMSLEKFGVFILYPPKTKFEKKYGWQYTTVRIIFDVKQQDLRYKTRLVGGRHVVDSTEHTKYLSTIKYVSIILMILIDAKNGLGLMARDIGNSF